MKSARASVVLLMAILLLTAAAAGQVPSPTGNLYGTALDEDKGFLAGVTVTLTGPGAARAAVTGTHGDFHFLDLSPGDYVVTLERTGFGTLRREVTVALGRNAVLAVTMPIAGAAEVVTVSGQGVAVDSRQTETGETFDRRALDTIPTTRDPWSTLRQVPGVLVDNMNVNGGASGVQSAFVGKGSHADQNTYNLDGVAITNPEGTTPVYFDFDSLQDISVVTGGADPELSTPGVTLNLVTRRGTNELRGSGRAYYFFPSSVDSTMNQVSSHGSWDYGLEAGGPLWKDHLWLWAAGAGNDLPGDTVLLPNGEPFRTTNDIQDWNAKLNAQPVPANALTLSYLHFDKIFDGRDAGPDRSFPSSWRQTTPTNAYRAEDSQVLSEKLFASLYFSYLSNDLRLTPEGGIDVQADYLGDPGVWQNSYNYGRLRNPQHQAGLTVSTFFDTGNLSHELKFGFGYKHTENDSFSAWPGDQLFGNEQLGLAAVTRVASEKFEINFADAYVRDTIKAGNLTVNLGLRFDYQEARNLPSAVPANPVFPELLPAVQYGGDSGYPITWKLAQPRVGATYTPGSDRKTLLRASYSTFANQLGTQIFNVNAFPTAALLYYYWTDINGNHRVEPNEVDFSSGLKNHYGVDPSDPGSSASINRLAPNLKPPQTDEFIVGVERQIFTDLSASIDYTHRSARNSEFPTFPSVAQPIVGVTRGDYQYAGNASGTVTGKDGFTLNFSEPYYDLTSCPDSCAGVVIENRPDYSVIYNGVELQVVKRLSHGWSLRAGFAYNDWTQSVGPGAIVNPNNFRGGTNASGAVVEPEGKLDNNSGSFINAKWQFNVAGTVQLPLEITAAANFFGRQGFPTVYFLRAITTDARGLERLPLQIGQVDAYRNPDVYELDLHVEKLFRIGKALTINPSLDCFNVANSHTVLQRVGNAGTYTAGATPSFKPNLNFNAPAEQLSDRAFRAGARITF